jgi:hypothetical protein
MHRKATENAAEDQSNNSNAYQQILIEFEEKLAVSSL